MLAHRLLGVAPCTFTTSAQWPLSGTRSLSQFGPFLLSAASFDKEYKRTGIPTPKRNPWTWANVTSLCEIDSPAPVGNSFCSEGNGTAGSHGGPSGDAYSCGPWTD